jgi:PAS domain S-box-containing protein
LLEVDENDTITLVNQSFCEISGYSVEEVLGRKAYDLLAAAESKKEFKDRLASRREGVIDSHELTVLNKKGEKRHWVISGAPNYDVYGKVIGSIGIHLDKTEQKEQEERLYLLSLIAEKNINSVIIADKEGKVEWVNASFTKMAGYSIEEMRGRRPGEVLQGPETDLQTVQYMREQVQKGLSFQCEIINYAKNGEKYWVAIQGQALYSKDNEIIKYFAIEENITDKKALENQREKLAQRLAISNKELEDYAHVVSHDLKSPLRSIHSLVSWIKEDNGKELSDQALDYFTLIENKVEKMDHLIDGILTYAKIDKINVVQEKVNVHEIVENIIKIIHIPVNSLVSIKSQLPTLKGDRFRLQQLFQNIISNALSHNDKAQSTVVIDCIESQKDFVFSIADNGSGIAKEDQERIFNTFQSLTNNDKATGLGLSIVKKIIDFYKGRIWLESQEKKGTTFYFTIPKNDGTS